MKNGYGIVAALAGALVSQGVLAAESAPVPYKPLTSWNLDYGAERCSLGGQFGDGKKDLVVRFDSYGSNTGFRLQLAGTAIPRSAPPANNFTYRFTPDTATPMMRTAIMGKVGAVQAASVGISFYPQDKQAAAAKAFMAPKAGRDTYFDGPDKAFEAGVKDMVVRMGHDTEIDVLLGDMVAPLKAMRACVADLRASWGLDPAQDKALTRRAMPMPPPPGAMPPPGMMMRGFGTFTPMRIMVDAQGTPTQCVVQSEGATEAVKKTACAGLMAMKYVPALDANGQPVASVYVSTESGF